MQLGRLQLEVDEAEKGIAGRRVELHSQDARMSAVTELLDEREADLYETEEAVRDIEVQRVVT